MSHTVPPSSLGSYPLVWRVPKWLLYLCRLPVYMRVEVVMMVLSLYSRMGAIERREEQETGGTRDAWLWYAGATKWNHDPC